MAKGSAYSKSISGGRNKAYRSSAAPPAVAPSRSSSSSSNSTAPFSDKGSTKKERYMASKKRAAAQQEEAVGAPFEKKNHISPPPPSSAPSSSAAAAGQYASSNRSRNAASSPPRAGAKKKRGGPKSKRLNNLFKVLNVALAEDIHLNARKWGNDEPVVAPPFPGGSEVSVLNSRSNLSVACAYFCEAIVGRSKPAVLAGLAGASEGGAVADDAADAAVARDQAKALECCADFILKEAGGGDGAQAKI